MLEEYEGESQAIKKRLGGREFVYHVFEMPWARRMNLFNDYRLLNKDNRGLSDSDLIVFALKRLRKRAVVEQREFLLRFDRERDRIKKGGM